MPEHTVIVGAARTPFGKYGGALRGASAVWLGGTAIREAVQRAGIRGDQVDKVVMGMALQGGAGQNPARQAARLAGLPWETTAETVNKVCASGLRAVTMAKQMIGAGDANIVVAGGMESMSNAPHGLSGLRWGSRMGNGTALDLMLHDGLTCPFDGVHMVVHGSHVAQEYGIGRAEQDAWALRSHQRAVRAADDGRLAEEIVPTYMTSYAQTHGTPIGTTSVPETNLAAGAAGSGANAVVERDEAPRRNTSAEALAKLQPVYDSGGSITAGNAPGVNDGAAALVLMPASKAEALGIQPLAAILGHAEVALEAPYIASAPGFAIEKLLRQTGYSLADIDLFEVNEAFAAVVLTSGKIVGWDPEKVNVNGGAIALGHPIGASGARIVMSLVYELRRRGGGLGIAAICSGTAQGDAVLVKV